jgi:RNA polymerase sigma factor (TIGR02999 family)
MSVCYFLSMSEVTRILSAVEQGDPHAAEQLLPLVYDELRRLAAEKLAQEKPGQTLQATALVHEAYIRLVDADEAQHWHGKAHFCGAAAEAMRRILIDRARAKLAGKRGGKRQRIDFDDAQAVSAAPPEALVAFDETLERLSQHDRMAGELVKLRCFAGLSVEEAGAALGLSRANAYRHWMFARAWLRWQLTGDEQPQR